jgi:hypothetical protein
MNRWLLVLLGVLVGAPIAVVALFNGAPVSRAAGPGTAYTLYLPLVARLFPPVLAVDMHLRWDGNGYLRGSRHYDIGWHLQRDLVDMTDADTIHSQNYGWYDPNPLSFESNTWDSYYSISTYELKSSSSPGDPSFKWDNPWVLPVNWQFSNGQAWPIDGQAFNVSGPYAGYTAFGQAVRYWQLVNRDTFLFWDGGGDWKQYVTPGDIKLRYDAGSNRLLLQSDVLRRDYYRGSPNGDTVQYIDNLTSDNNFRDAKSARDVVSPPANSIGEHSARQDRAYQYGRSGY